MNKTLESLQAGDRVKGCDGTVKTVDFISPARCGFVRVYWVGDDIPYQNVRFSLVELSLQA